MLMTDNLQLTRQGRALMATLLLGLSVTWLSGCATATSSGAYHGVIMRGQIVSLEGRSGVICIGQQDNAEAGQVLDVVRHQPRQVVGHSRPRGFERVVTGQVRIVRIVDGHYSDIEVVAGDVRETDTVELESN